MGILELCRKAAVSLLHQDQEHIPLETHRNDPRPYDTAVLIDMQSGFVGGLRRGALPRILKSQIKVLGQCVEENIPTVVLEYRGHGKTIDELAAVLSQVPRTRTIIKSNDDGFENTTLHKTLRSWGSQNLLLMGINAEACVKETAQSALRLNYAIATSSKLIAGMSHHDKEDCIPWYSENGTLVRI